MAAPLNLLSTEDEDAYELIRTELTLAIQPTDFVEWLWVNDLTDHIWEERRAKQAKVIRLKLAKRKAVERVMRSIIPDNATGHPDFEHQLQTDISQILMGEEIPSEGFRQMCEGLGIKNLDFSAIGYETAIKDLEALQRIIDRAAGRRMTILREIDRRRDARSRRVREAIANLGDVQDAEFE